MFFLPKWEGLELRAIEEILSGVMAKGVGKEMKWGHLGNIQRQHGSVS